MTREGFLILGLLFLFGCARDTEPDLQAKRLNAQEAAELAADLANRECNQMYGHQPFKSEDHIAKVIDGRWQWGRRNLGGPRGLSAKVAFDADGSDPDVTVYLSLDVAYLR